MHNTKYLMIILAIGVFYSSLHAQEGEDKDWDEYVEYAWKGDFSPYFEFDYSITQPKQELFEGEFAKLGSYEARIGYSDINPWKKFILGMDERYLFGSVYKQDFNHFDTTGGGVVTEAKRFGFGNRLGFGYDLGPIHLLPYSQTQYQWTEFNPVDSTGITENDAAILNRYAGAFRFGHSAEAGIKIQFLNSISVSAGYEFAVIDPRIIFWPWLGSQLIEHTALGMISVFSEEIVNSSPLLGPIMYFVLRNGVAWAFYQGYKEKMNWPFDSETPLTLESIKIGASITF